MNLLEIKEFSINNKKSLAEIGLKLSEETGEVAQALLSYLGSNGSEYKNLGVEDVKEESVDVIIVALSLFFKAGGTLEELDNTIVTKANKWKQKAGL